MAIITVPTDSELDVFFRSYGGGFTHVTPTLHGIEAGTVNSSYAVTFGTERCFLRIYEEQGEEGARHEAALLLHLAASGVPTPSPLAGLDGALVRTLSGKPAALFPWVDGGMFCQRSVTPEAAHALGEALACVHLAGAPPGAVPSAGRFAPSDLVVRCDRVASSTDAEARALAPALRQAVLDVAARRDPALPSGLVHGDLFRDNVLWQGGRIAALLDFESAHHGPFAYDLAVTILSWAFDDTFVPDIARAIVDGYGKRRVLGDAERVGLFDEAIFGALRFTITRITDDAIRVGKRWQRFVARRDALEAMGRDGLREMVGL